MRYFAFLFFLLLFSCQQGEVSNYKAYLNLNDTVKYVGKEQCRMCHAEIYDSYIQTGMGKSLHYAIKDHSALTNSDMPIIYDSINNLFYEPIWKNDSLYIKDLLLPNCIGLSPVAFFIFLTTSTWTGFISSNFLFCPYWLCFL